MVTTLFASTRMDHTDVNVHQVKLCPHRAATAAVAAAAAEWVPLEYIVTLGRGGGDRLPTVFQWTKSAADAVAAGVGIPEGYEQTERQRQQHL